MVLLSKGLEKHIQDHMLEKERKQKEKVGIQDMERGRERVKHGFQQKFYGWEGQGYYGASCRGTSNATELIGTYIMTCSLKSKEMNSRISVY